MNVLQLQEVLKMGIKHGNLLGLPVVDLTETEVETRDIPISLPKVAWKILDMFDIKHIKTEASVVRLFEETIITTLLNNPTAIMAMTVKGGPND